MTDNSQNTGQEQKPATPTPPQGGNNGGNTLERPSVNTDSQVQKSDTTNDFETKTFVDRLENS